MGGVNGSGCGGLETIRGDGLARSVIAEQDSDLISGTSFSDSLGLFVF